MLSTVIAEEIVPDDFESVALPHMNDLFRTALRSVGNRTEAEDLVQETYYQAWKSFHRFQAGTNCRAWLFKILFHVINHHRRRWYNSAPRVESAEGQDFEDILVYEPPIPEDLHDEDILSALEQIREQYRQVVILADVQEFAYKEIAEILDIPVGTVMSRLSRGRKQLRAQLGEVARGYGLGPPASLGAHDAESEPHGSRPASRPAY